MRNFLTVRQVADHLNMHFMSVYKMLQAGTLPALKVGNRWKIDETALESWIESQRSSQVTSGSQPVSRIEPAPGVNVIFLDLLAPGQPRPGTYVIALSGAGEAQPILDPEDRDSRTDEDEPTVLMARPVDGETARQFLNRIPKNGRQWVGA